MNYYGNNDYRDYLALKHHGILGMKWGQRNGPPYPLDGSDHSVSEKKAGWRKSLSGGSSGTVKKKNQKTKKSTAKSRRRERDQRIQDEYFKKMEEIEKPYKKFQNLSPEDLKKEAKLDEDSIKAWAKSKEQYKKERAKEKEIAKRKSDSIYKEKQTRRVHYYYDNAIEGSDKKSDKIAEKISKAKAKADAKVDKLSDKYAREKSFSKDLQTLRNKEISAIKKLNSSQISEEKKKYVRDALLPYALSGDPDLRRRNARLGSTKIREIGTGEKVVRVLGYGANWNNPAIDAYANKYSKKNKSKSYDKYRKEARTKKK